MTAESKVEAPERPSSSVNAATYARPTPSPSWMEQAGYALCSVAVLGVGGLVGYARQQGEEKRLEAEEAKLLASRLAARQQNELRQQRLQRRQQQLQQGKPSTAAVGSTGAPAAGRAGARPAAQSAAQSAAESAAAAATIKRAAARRPAARSANKPTIAPLSGVSPASQAAKALLVGTGLCMAGALVTGVAVCYALGASSLRELGDVLRERVGPRVREMLGVRPDPRIEAESSQLAKLSADEEIAHWQRVLEKTVAASSEPAGQSKQPPSR